MYKEFRDKIGAIETKLASLQDAEDNYYLTTNYVLELANRAYDLFVSSEMEQKRQTVGQEIEDKFLLLNF